MRSASLSVSQYGRTKVIIAAGGEKFSVGGRTVISLGFTAAMPWLAVADESLPPFQAGESISLAEVELYQVRRAVESPRVACDEQ